MLVHGWLASQRRGRSILAFLPPSLPYPLPYLPLADRPAHDHAPSFTPNTSTV